MPQAVGAWLATTLFLNTGISVAAALAINSIVTWTIQLAIVSSVSAGLRALFTPKPKSGAAGQVPAAADGHISIRQPTPPRVSGFGRARLAGAYMLYFEREGDSYDVLAMHDGLIDEVEIWYLNDDPVVPGDGLGGAVAALTDGRYAGGVVQLYRRRGLATETAYSEITAAIPDVWTAAHRGDGIASVALICNGVSQEDFSAVYSGGLPQVSIVARLQIVHDIRVSTDWANASAKVWSDNPILCLLYYLVNDQTGMGLPYERRILPAIDYWLEAARVCEEQSPLAAGGSYPKYHCGGFYTHDTDPADVIAQLLLTCDGWMATRGDGALVVYAGKFYEPTVVIEAKHILEFSIQRFVADEEAVNELTVSYTSPAHKYNDVDADTWIDAADQASRGKPRADSLQATWIQHHPQARRIAKRRVKRANAPARGWIRTNLFGLAALGERYIRIQNPTLPSLANITAEITNIEMDLSNLGVVITWVMVGPDIDDWDPATEEGTAPPVLDDE